MAGMPERDFLNAKLQQARAPEELTNEKEQLAKERVQLVRAYEHVAKGKAALAKEKAMAYKQLTNEKEQLGKELSQLMEAKMQLVREQAQLTNEKEQLAKERAQLENTITQLRPANAKLTSERSNSSKATVAATDGMLRSCAAHIWAVFQAHRCPQLPMAQNCRLFEWCAELLTYGTATYLRMWECLRQVLVLIAKALA